MANPLAGAEMAHSQVVPSLQNAAPPAVPISVLPVYKKVYKSRAVPVYKIAFS
jgi:hypothetical protein